MDWIIEPYVGIGALRFGMSRDAVSDVLGPMETERDNGAAFSADPALAKRFRNNITEFRIFGDVSTMRPTVTFADDRLESVDFDRNHSTLSLGGRFLLRESRKAIVEYLFGLDDDVYDTVQGYVFRGIGVSLAKPQASREVPTVNVFARGVFDHDIDDGLYPRIEHDSTPLP